MKITKWILTSLLVGFSLSFAGCRGGVYLEEGIFVHHHPPPARVEIMTACPGPDYVWISGSWAWHDHWVWNRGYWGRRPHAGAIWVDSHWQHHHGGWKHHRGHWR